MSQSNRRYQLALRGYLIALALAGSAALAQENPSHDQNQAGQSTRQRNEADRPAASTHFLDHYKVDAETYRAICDQPKDKDHAELCQQWRSAEAAHTQVLLSAFALAGILASLFFTGWAAKAAARAAIAAEKAVEVNDRTAERQLRAYIDIKSGGFALGPPHKDRLRVRVVFSNFGQTPARDVRLWIKMDLVEPGKFEFTERSKPGVEQGIISPGNTAVSFDGIGVDDDIAFDAIKEGDMVPMVWGRVIYRDVFDNRDHTFEFIARNGTYSLVDEGKNKGQHCWMLLPAEGGYKST
jgi:hypothetical protein